LPTSSARHIRFTRKGDALYAIALAWPANGTLSIKTLASGSAQYPKTVQRVELLGGGALQFTRDASSLTVTLPSPAAGPRVPVLKIV
jgi:alpha-L-fucosidase